MNHRHEDTTQETKLRHKGVPWLPLAPEVESLSEYMVCCPILPAPEEWARGGDLKITCQELPVYKHLSCFESTE